MSITTQRRVSTDLYRHIEESGYLTGWRWIVFNYIWQRHQAGQGTTSTEARRDLPHKENSTISARFTDLERMKAIKVVGTKLDPVDGRIEVCVYEPTYQMPIALPKKRQFWIIRVVDDYVVYVTEKKARADYALHKNDEGADVDSELISVMERYFKKKPKP